MSSQAILVMWVINAILWLIAVIAVTSMLLK
jgi:hypothetical protein